MMNAKRAASAVIGGGLGALVGFFGVELGANLLLGLPGIAFILAMTAAGAVIAALSRPTVALWIPALLGLCFLIVALSPLAGALAGSWVRSDARPSPKTIVVLSSGVLSNGALAVSGAERLLTAAELARRTGAERLVTTRVTEHVAGRVLTSDDDQRRLIGLIAPAPHWIVVDSVSTTRDEAVRAARALFPGDTDVAVVTSPMHTRRACAAFEAVGFRVTCVPALERETVTWRPTSADERLASFRAYVYERFGWAKYRWKGWVRG